MGEEFVQLTPRTGMGAEDFSYFVQPEHGVKGVYFSVGGTPRDQVETAPSHHSPFFYVEPAPSIKSGVEATVISAMELMSAP
jgi:hippurate hydrolase